ncbi:hypothetical protein [uncultured Shewanella sp.]|uniref:hypothetical protein n=1 Tax=uncultured Shewanella sp. TaxID=173975 RepID=UPI00261D636F|nr:hypothetical protein [uncultured Shewanella sp.]
MGFTLVGRPFVGGVIGQQIANGCNNPKPDKPFPHGQRWPTPHFNGRSRNPFSYRRDDILTCGR